MSERIQLRVANDVAALWRTQATDAGVTLTEALRRAMEQWEPHDNEPPVEPPPVPVKPYPVTEVKEFPSPDQVVFQSEPWPDSPRSRALRENPKLPSWCQDQMARESGQAGICWECGYDGLKELQEPHDCTVDNARREYLA